MAPLIGFIALVINLFIGVVIASAILSWLVAFNVVNMNNRFVLAIADRGWRRALSDDPHLRNGLNVYDGMVTHRAVADALKIKCTPAEAALRL